MIMRRRRSTLWCIIYIYLIFNISAAFAQKDKPKPIPKNSPYIMHVVKLGETLTKIAKKYEVSTADILKVNPSMTAGNLMSEQIIRIPNLHSSKEVNTSKAADYKKIPTVIDDMKLKEKEKAISLPPSNRLHTVEQGQTMYAIAKMYGVSVSDIQKWNDLPDYTIKIGSQLIVGKGTENVIPAKKETPIEPKPTPNDIKTAAPPAVLPKASITEKNELKTTVNSPKKPEIKEQLPTDEAVQPAISETEKPETQASDNATQNELAKLYKTAISTKKVTSVRGTGAPMTTSLGAMENVYLVMHKSLPIGTIIKVKNLVNSKIIYAKIIGKLPDTDENKHVIVRYTLGVKKDLQLQNGKCYVQIEYPQ